jgi:hypothetical protein
MVRAVRPPLTPAPSGDHVVPFQRAMFAHATPPMVVKLPPAKTSPLGWIASAPTPPLPTDPSSVHDVPFQRATLYPLAPKSPLTTRSPAAVVAIAHTDVALPRVDQLPVAGSKTAKPFALRLPAATK